MKYKAIIIGAGSIGALKPYEFDNPNSENILTVANAFYRHKQVDLVGIVDIDMIKAGKAALKWNTNAFASLDEVDDDFDIAAVCVPTEYHFEVILDLLNNYDQKIILAEKPFTENLSFAECLKRKAKGTMIAINYIRRYDFAVSGLKMDIKLDLLGEIYGCKIAYNRGLMHEGCHAIDLMRYLFGGVKKASIINKQKKIYDLNKDNDFTYAAYFSLEKCPHAFMIPVDGRSYSVFEIEIWTQYGKIVFSDHGLNYDFYGKEKEKTYGNYFSLPSEPHRIKTNLNRALLEYADQAVRYIEKGIKPNCTIDDAIKVHQIYKHLRRKINDNM